MMRGMETVFFQGCFPFPRSNFLSLEPSMLVLTYLHFNGQCEAALKFYQQHLGAEILYLGRYKDSPMESQTEPEMHDKVMHSTFQIGSVRLMASDASSSEQAQMHGFSLSLTPETAVQAESAFNALSENGKVTMPLQKTFFAERFGMLVDQFGIPWMIHFEK
jgi:PhnB protein